jgi:hypothetical protein
VEARKGRNLPEKHRVSKYGDFGQNTEIDLVLFLLYIGPFSVALDPHSYRLFLPASSILFSGLPSNLSRRQISSWLGQPDFFYIALSIKQF